MRRIIIYNNIQIRLYCCSIPRNRGRQQSGSSDTRPPGGSVHWVSIRQSAFHDVRSHAFTPGLGWSPSTFAVCKGVHYSLDASCCTDDMSMPSEPTGPQYWGYLLQAELSKQGVGGHLIRDFYTAHPANHIPIILAYVLCRGGGGFTSMEHSWTHTGIVNIAMYYGWQLFGGEDGAKFLKLTPGSTESGNNCPCATSFSIQHISKVAKLIHHFHASVQSSTVVLVSGRPSIGSTLGSPRHLRQT